QQLTKGDFTVGGFAWHPDGQQIAFNRQKNPLILSGTSSDIVLIHTATKKMDTLVNHPMGDFFLRWSPDGLPVAYDRDLDASSSVFYRSSRRCVDDMVTKTSRGIATDIGDNRSVADWNKHGLFYGAAQKTRLKLDSVDVKTGRSKRVNAP